MKRTELLKLSPIEEGDLPLSHAVHARSRIDEIDGEQVLEIDLFYLEELKARYFTDGKNYYTWSANKWSTRRLDNAALAAKGNEIRTGEWYYYGAGNYEWASDEDERRAKQYLDGCSVETCEYSITSDKNKRAYERKVDRIKCEMGQVPVLPDEVGQWVEQKIFPENYLFFRETPTGYNYSCTACGCSSWWHERWKRGEKTVCPKCGTDVIAKPWKEQTMERHENVVVLQEYIREKPVTFGSIKLPVKELVWIERQFKAVCTWEQDAKRINLYENIRAIMPDGQTYGKVYYGTKPEADEFEQEFWDSNTYNKRFCTSYLYPDNLQDVLPNCLKRNGIIEMSSQKFPVNKYIISGSRRPWLEYLVKAGLKDLTSDIVETYTWGIGWSDPDRINVRASNLKDALMLDGNRVNRLKQINGNLCILRWLQYEQRMEEEGQRLRISQESLEFLNAKKLYPDDCREILEDLGSVNRMVNYMKKQKVAPSKLIYTWRDYLRMARDEGLDTTDDIIRFPRDLKARHDQMVEQINRKRDEERARKNAEKYQELDKKIRENLPEVRKYFYEDDTYMIIPAGKCQELITEGQILHHCVGSSDNYMRKMANKESWILFLRKKENLEKPWYTIEIRMKDDKILQYYSEFDRQPELEKVDAVLERFKGSIRRSRVRVA